MNENNNVEDCLVQGWAIDVSEYADYYKISLEKATKEVKKACLKMGFKCYWEVLEVEGIILNRHAGHMYYTDKEGLVMLENSYKFEYTLIDRVLKKTGSGFKARIYKPAALKQYIKEVLKPDNSKAA